MRSAKIFNYYLTFYELFDVESKRKLGLNHFDGIPFWLNYSIRPRSEQIGTTIYVLED